MTAGHSLQGYAQFVRRNRALIAALTLLGAAAGSTLVVRSPVEYVAQESVAVTPQPTGAQIDPDRPSLVSLDSDAQILSSGDVLTRAAATSGFTGGADALAESLDVSARPNSRVLIVRVTSDDRDSAVAACAAVVDEFLQTRAATETQRAQATAAKLSAEIASVLDGLSALDTAVPGDSTDAATSASAASQLARDQQLARLADLEDQLRVVTTAATALPGTITSAASAPASGARPMAGATVASGLLLGALTGVGVASVRDGGLSRTTILSRRPGGPPLRGHP